MRTRQLKTARGHALAAACVQNNLAYNMLAYGVLAYCQRGWPTASTARWHETDG